LAELTEKVMRFPKEDELGRGLAGDEVRMLTEEFWRLDDQLTKARADLLERHRRELELERRLQHAERLATIGTLASGLAHEIGTPMGVIRARAEYLLQIKPAPAKNQEGLEIIVGQIDRISRIVRMLLDYARARGHDLSVAIAQLDLNEPGGRRRQSSEGLSSRGSRRTEAPDSHGIRNP
jgi:signal transduction histidine kinase